MPIEQVIAAHLHRLFPGMKVDGGTSSASRATLTSRSRWTRQKTCWMRCGRSSCEGTVASGRSPGGRPDDDERDPLATPAGARLKATDVSVIPGLLNLSDLWSLTDLNRPSLKPATWQGVTNSRLAGTPAPDIFAVMREGDLLVHHPYDSFSTSVEEFVRQASLDPHVLAIKQTLYRTSDEESPIVHALIRAAEAGKQAVALVELKARFDEEANIAWAGKLEQAGVHVAYGVVGLKTHAKAVLVVREEGGDDRALLPHRHRQLQPGDREGLRGSGPADGRTRVDAETWLISSTSSPATVVPALVREGCSLLPSRLRQRLLELIHEEAEASDGRIVIKVNNLIDPADHRRPLRRLPGGDGDRSHRSLDVHSSAGR